MSRSGDGSSLLDAVTGALPDAEDRPGQQTMAGLVADAIERGRHLIVQAGTGTGKTLAYLVPAIAAGRRVVVATATKALQDQLATKDLPFLASAMPEEFTFTSAVLKGRSNYLCLQRVSELSGELGAAGAQGELELPELSRRSIAELQRLTGWIAAPGSGDLAAAPVAVSEATARAITVGSEECPGRTRCTHGKECYAELARQRAAEADVVVVNTHLYGLDVAAGGAVLPEHDVVVFDEAHGLEDIMSDTVGLQLTPGRFVTLAGVLRRVLADADTVGGVADLADLLRTTLAPHVGSRLSDPYPGDLHEALLTARSRLGAAHAAVNNSGEPDDEARQRKLRAQLATAAATAVVDVTLGDDPPLIGSRDDLVDFVSGSPQYPRLELAPLDVGPTLREGVWRKRTAILTSATIPTSLAARVGFADAAVDTADVGSPFDYEHHALLYCPVTMPDPRHDRYRDAVHDELTALITAAGGRTLALFTSWKAMDAAAEAVAERVDVPILTQRDLPKPALIKTFAADEATCLFATAGLFQGVDVPGDALIQVVIDRLPFPRPDDPLLSARRERIGAAAFSTIDLPRAAMMLAQAAGRLIRTATDRGVVAVLDRRLGTARYRWDIVNALPPMRRTRHRADVESFLSEITTPS